MSKTKKILRDKLDFINDLKDPSTNFQIPEYIIIKEEDNNIMKPSIKPKKYTLNMIGKALFDFIETTNKKFKDLEKSNNERFDRLEVRMDKLESRMDKLESRMDNIEKRLDYNNLKKLPQDK